MLQYDFDECQITDRLKLLINWWPEGYFGPESALLTYGLKMDAASERPVWIEQGRNRECYANCVKALLSEPGLESGDLVYAEGYANQKNSVWVPMQHAWLVDREGRVVDPTWQDASDHVYFGVTFKTSFVLDMLGRAKLEPGLLVTPKLMRRHFGTPQLFEAGIHEAHDLSRIPPNRMTGGLSWQAPFPPSSAPVSNAAA